MSQLIVDIEGFVLAGGMSRRFGSDKARAMVEQRTLVERNAHILSARYARVRVVSAPGRSYADLGLDTVYDISPGSGPLAGIEAALQNAETPIVAVAACDLLGLSAHWYEELEAHVGSTAAAYRDDRWHPLVAVYHRELLAEIQQRLADGRRAVRDLLDTFGHAVVPPADFSALRSVDTPDLMP